MANQNSFTETTKALVSNVNVALESLVKINESMTTKSSSVTIEGETIDPITGDTSTYKYSIPSYNYAISKMNTVSSAMDQFINGEGVVVLNDGTYREVKTTPLAQSPISIKNVSTPTKFYTKSNWFFEDLIFPQTYVQFDLKNKISDESDRIFIKRIIFDNFDDTETQWFKDNIASKTFTYPELMTLYANNFKKYWEDEQLVDLPLFNTDFEGVFSILERKIITGENWYYLDTINYGENTDDDTVKNLELKKGDQIRYNDNTLFQVEEIVITEKRVKLIPMLGLANPVIGDSFSIYSPPFNEKIADVAVGYNECNTLFIKGVNDNYNITSGDWGDSISYYTNDLTYEDTTQVFENYYFRNVVDYGAEMQGRIKDRYIPAFNGSIPDAPILISEQFEVSQVNTQINSSLDTEAIKSTQTQIESTKTIINSLKNTIAQQKSELVELTDPASRADLQSKINANTISLSKQTIEYQSLVRSLATVAYENDAVINNPKYRVRGFFDIPNPKTLTNDPDEIAQQIIQFDISYRYLRLDGTGNPLNIYSYADPSTGQKVTGTYTDWVISPSPIKKKVYDSSMGVYTWVDEEIADGTEVNINQVDVALTKGEQVEIRIRSISEAGWPINSLKSEWSNAVVIGFPSNLQGTDQIINILSDSQAEETAIKLDETLNAAGVTTHIDDSVPNPNAAEGTYFKHQSKFLGFDYSSDVDITTGIAATQSTVDLQTFLDTIGTKVYITVADPSALGTPKTVILSTLLQNLMTNPIYNAL